MSQDAASAPKCLLLGLYDPREKLVLQCAIAFLAPHSAARLGFERKRGSLTATSQVIGKSSRPNLSRSSNSLIMKLHLLTTEYQEKDVETRSLR